MDSSSPIPVHLLCLMHGMWGNPAHLDEAARIIREKAASRQNSEHLEFEVLVAQANQEGSTYDGIDWGGERIADEIIEHIQDIEKDSKKKVTKFSVLGYSLGGLLGRYVIGILQSRKFFETVEPVNFNTIATPHIGLLRYPSVWSSLTNKLGPLLLSRTGEQFYTVDTWNDSEMSLLEFMAMPDSIFVQALQRFPNLAIYANAVNDLTVPYATASMSEEDPFGDHAAQGLKVEFLEKYKPIISSFTVPDTPPPKPKSPRVFSKAWFRGIKELRPPLPPFLQKPFPLNLVLYAALPILFPTFICVAIVKLSLDSRASRTRIKMLEADAAESGQGRLITLLRRIEQEMDDVVADFVDEPGPNEGVLLEQDASEGSEGSGTSSSVPSRVSSPPTSSDETVTVVNPSEKTLKEGKPLLSSESKSKSECTSKSKSKKQKPAKHVPQLKPSQQRMVHSLNTELKHLKKHAAFIHPTRNSHGTIISRDVKNFDFHRLGEGVLLHWADNFVF